MAQRLHGLTCLKQSMILGGKQPCSVLVVQVVVVLHGTSVSGRGLRVGAHLIVGDELGA